MYQSLPEHTATAHKTHNLLLLQHRSSVPAVQRATCKTWQAHTRAHDAHSDAAHLYDGPTVSVSHAEGCIALPCNKRPPPRSRNMPSKQGLALRPSSCSREAHVQSPPQSCRRRTAAQWLPLLPPQLLLTPAAAAPAAIAATPSLLPPLPHLLPLSLSLLPPHCCCCC